MTECITLNDSDGFVLEWSSEFDIRDGLAGIALRYGWRVETEHVIPGWGRPDLYLSTSEMAVAVEIKTELATPSKCRKAIQQTDNYRRAMPEVSGAYLVAAHVNQSVMEPYATAYPAVTVMTVAQFFGALAGLCVSLPERHKRALRGLREAERELELRRRIVSDLSRYESSPLAPRVDAVLLSKEVAVMEIFDMFWGAR